MSFKLICILDFGEINPRTHARYHDPLNPEQVMLVVILTHYYENHSDSKPSAHVAKRAGVLVMEFLEIDDLFKRLRKGDSEPFNITIAHAESKGIKRITQYTLRHFMATRVRGLKEVAVDREQRSLWLGHGKKDATSWYETFDREHLHEAAGATNIILEKLDALTIRTMVPLIVKQRKILAGLLVVNG